jgi:hypothetical protein
LADPTATAATGEPAPSGLAHGLRWAIKRSFLAYVRRMPDGRGWVGEGAVPVGTDEMFFGLDPDNTKTTATGGVWAFAGDVRFTGHFGMLSVRITRPWLHLDGPTALVTVEDPYGDPAAARLGLVSARVEQVEVREGTQVYLGTDVRLEEAAIGVFNEVYPVGEPFEDFVVQVPLLLL